MNLIGSFAALLVVALGYGVIVPLAPTLLRNAMGSMDVAALSLHTGALSATYLFAFAALAPLWGRVVDAASRSRVAAGGLIGFAVSFGTLALSGRAEVLYASVAVAGIFAAAVLPAIQVDVARIAGDTARARLLSVFGAASFTGWFLGPPLASWTIARRTLGGVPAEHVSLAFVALLALIAAGLVVRRGRPAPTAPPIRPAPGSGSARATWIFAALAMAVTFGIGAFEVSLVLWVVQVLRLDASIVSRMLIECTVVMMAVQATIFVMPAARPSWNPIGAALAFVAMGVAIGAIPFSTAPWSGFLAVAVIAATATLLQTMLSLGTVAYSADRAGSALGLQLSLSSAGQGLGSLGAGALFSPSGGGFLLAGVVSAAAGVWALTLRR